MPISLFETIKMSDPMRRIVKAYEDTKDKAIELAKAGEKTLLGTEERSTALRMFPEAIKETIQEGKWLPEPIREPLKKITEAITPKSEEEARAMGLMNIGTKEKPIWFDITGAMGGIKKVGPLTAKITGTERVAMEAKALAKRGIRKAEEVVEKVIPPIKPPIKLPITPELAELPATPEGARLRGIVETVQTSPQTTKELKTALGETYPFYEPITNKQTLKTVDRIIRADPDAARLRILSEEPISAEKSAMAVRLMKHYEAGKNYDAVIEVLNSYDKQLRQAGRGVQAASLWNKLSPETIVRTAQREAQKIGRELPLDVQKVILRRMEKVVKMAEGAEKDKATMEVLNYVADQLPPKWSDIFDAYRYQNMLSSPRSHERNISGNTFNVFITRPLDLLAEATYDLFRHPFNPMARDIKFSDIPKYYKDTFTVIPQAISAFKEAFRQGYVSQKIMEMGGVGTRIEALRRTKLPGVVTAIPRFMEAQDRFFSILIGQGEKARLMAGGMAEDVAESSARTLAEQYLYRERLGTTAKTESLFVRALDDLGQLTLQGRKLPAIGKVWSWFVPFVTTPINIAKFGVQRSPLGFIGGARTKQQVSQAFLGTMVSGIGAILALQDKTTWALPTDKKERELFYASGKKPYSIQIGDAQVPLYYFGPFSIALGLPASIKYFQTDTKKALTDGDIKQVAEAIFSISRFITSQTPLSGMEGFVKAIEGDIDYTSWGQMGFTAEQIIPLTGLVRYINTILDPVYRKASGFTEAIMKDLPILSQQLEAYPTPTGEPARREPVSYFLPYDIGITKPEWELPLLGRRTELQQRALEQAIEGEEVGVGGVSSLGKTRKQTQEGGISSLGK